MRSLENKLLIVIGVAVIVALIGIVLENSIVILVGAIPGLISASILLYKEIRPSKRSKGD